VVLIPQLSAARAADDDARYGALLDTGLRLVLLLALPCAVALLLFAQPLVAVLYHYGAFQVRDVSQTTSALMGYGIGLVGLVAIKVLAPGFYANQDTRTPVRIAVAVLVLTQLLNLALVPWLAHAGLAWSIGLAALVNAGWLWLGLRRQGRYQPAAGWGRLVLQVVVACGVLALWLSWCAASWDWTGLQTQPWTRVGAMGAVLAVSAVLYFGSLRLTGLPLRTLWRQ